MHLFGKISSMAGNLKVAELRFCFWLYSLSIQSKQSRMENDHYIQGDRYIQVNFAQKYRKATENFGKLYGDRNIYRVTAPTRPFIQV